MDAYTLSGKYECRGKKKDMKVKEVEELLGITRANIRFYEKEGLLSPARDSSGYRSYEMEDIVTLKKIILFRKLGISILDIKKVMNGEALLSDVIEENTATLERQRKEIEGALQMSRKMSRDESIDSGFDVEEYWKEMETEEANGSVFFDIVKDYAEFEKMYFTACG